ADDGPAIERLYEAATAELRAERGGEIWARQQDRDAGLRPPGAADGAVFAGTLDGVVVGYAVVRVEQLPDVGELALIDYVYVEPAARAVGVGEVLLVAGIARGRERGCVGIDSLALPGMRATKNFFEAAGLVARAIVVPKRLVP